MFPQPVSDLLREFDVEPGSAIALIGGGGKTTLMERLAADSATAGHRVLMTTSTRIRPPFGLPIVIASQPGELTVQLREAWQRNLVVAAGSRIDSSGKLHGLDPDTICTLTKRFDSVVTVCEADGSAGMPLKVHADHEPVIPRCSKTVGIIGGLDAVGRPVCAGVIHRFERLEPRFRNESTVTPMLMARLLAAAADRVPDHTVAVYVLNQADTPDRQDVAVQVKRMLLQLRPGVRVVATCRGVVIPDNAPASGAISANRE